MLRERKGETTQVFPTYTASELGEVILVDVPQQVKVQNQSQGSGGPNKGRMPRKALALIS